MFTSKREKWVLVALILSALCRTLIGYGGGVNPEPTPFAEGGQTSVGMRLARASPENQNPARLSLILNAHWNEGGIRDRKAQQPNRSGLKPAGTERSFEAAEVFRQLSGPAQAPAGLLGMFEGEDFGVQGLPREINARICAVRSAKSRVVG